MSLPAPIAPANDNQTQQQAIIKITIANCTNPHLRDLVITYEARKSQILPLAVAETIWGTISWVWQNARSEAEETIKKHVQAADLDAWLLAQYNADVAKYKSMPIPAKTT